MKLFSRRFVSFLLAWAVIIPLLPTVARAEGAVAVLTTDLSLSSPEKPVYYVIANSNTAGGAFALNGDDNKGTSVTIHQADGQITQLHIKDPDPSILWEVQSGYTLRNLKTGKYLYHDNTSNTLTLGSQDPANWQYSADTLFYKTTSASPKTYYLRYSNKWVLDSRSSKIYFYELEPVAPSQPSELAQDSIAIDFGLSVDIDVSANDPNGGSITAIGSQPPDAEINTEVYPHSALSLSAGGGNYPSDILPVGEHSARIMDERTIRFTPGTTDFSAPVTFYYEVAVDGGYLYSSVTVTPDSSVYYEEDFLTFTDSPAADGEVGRWHTVGDPRSSVQQSNLPGETLCGYDPAYDNSPTYSMGGGREVVVTAATGSPDTAPSAQFTFTGTGFDLISRTDSTCGAIVVTVTDAAGNTAATRTVDLYYGYTHDSQLGWQVSAEASDPLWQVPAVKVTDLAYGTYTVTITPAYLSALDHRKAGEYRFCLDALRIYDPCGNDTSDAIPVRDVLLHAGSLNAGDAALPGAVFVDGMGEVTDIDTYANPGPNHEVYLARGQGIAFKLLADREPKGVHLGAKLASGNTGTLMLGEEKFLTLATATDMYYDLGSRITFTPNSSGKYESEVIVLSNSSDAILSLTDLRATGGARWDLSGVSALSLADEATVFSIMPVADGETVQTAARVIDALPSAPAFSDVDEGAWYAGAVAYAVENDLMTASDGRFLPTAQVSRAQMVQTLYSMAGKPAVADALLFSDVAQDSWYADAVNWAAGTSLASGTGAGTFSPNSSVTREQLALFLYARAGSPETAADLSGFADSARVSPWALRAVEWAVSQGLLSGKSGNLLDPQGTATRGELAQILMNVHKNS